MKTLFFFILLPVLLLSQNSEWENFINYETVLSSCVQEDSIWFGTNAGLVKFNKNNKNLTYYNTGNSDIPSNSISDIQIDSEGKLWLALDFAGMATFDHGEWEHFNSSNSPVNIATQIIVDKYDNKWIKVFFEEILKFSGDRRGWEIFDTTNSEIKNYDYGFGEFQNDNNGNIYIGTNSGLLKYDGEKWNNFNKSNSSIPFDKVSHIAIQENGDLWVGTNVSSTSFSLARYDGNSWQSYSLVNIGLSQREFVTSIMVDNEDNVWITSGDFRLIKFDGNEWNTYQKPNSTLYPTLLKIDDENNIWVALESFGFAKFDGTDWTTYDKENYEKLNTIISALEVDSDGNIWLGLWDTGLVKFDGTNWTLYENSSEYNLGSIMSIQEDIEGKIWVTDFNTSLYVIDNAEFKEVYSPAPLYTHFYSSFIDEAGNKWLTTSKGIYKYFGDGKETWTSYSVYNTDMPDNSKISSIALGSTGNLWVGTYTEGVIKFDGENWINFNEDNSDLNTNFISAIAIDSDNNKWIGSNGELYFYDDQTFTVFDNSVQGINWDHIRTIKFDGAQVWFGADNGLTKFDGVDWEFFNSSNSILPYDGVSSILVDDETKWFSTYEGVVSLNNGIWEHHILTASDYLTRANYITDIVVDEDNVKWFGTSAGLIKYEGETWQYTDIRSQPAVVELDNDENLWIGFQINFIDWNLGGYNLLIKYDGTTITNYTTFNSGIPGSFILAISIDSLNNKWLGSEDGLIKFDGTNSELFNTLNSVLPNNWVDVLETDLEGVLWIGTEDGLVKYDGADWTLFNTSNSSLPDNDILTIFVDRSNNKWIGTRDGGLAKYDNSTWTIYNSSNSLITSNSVNAIDIDDNDDLWLGTGNGLVKFDGNNWINYNRANSQLPSDGISSLAIDKNNFKWFNGSAGVTVFRGDSVFTPSDIIEAQEILSQSFSLSQNYPNPFNPSTTIGFYVSEFTSVTLKLYDVLGQLVKTLLDKNLYPGKYEVNFNANEFSSGIYFYRIDTKSFSQTKKMLLIK